MYLSVGESGYSEFFLTLLLQEQTEQTLEVPLKTGDLIYQKNCLQTPYRLNCSIFHILFLQQFLLFPHLKIDLHSVFGSD